jgi:hypothetical protein
MADVLHDNSCFFWIGEPLNEFKFLNMLYLQHCSIVKSLLSVVKIQNGGYIQDGVENFYIFHPIFSKMIIFHFFFTMGKKKTFF